MILICTETYGQKQPLNLNNDNLWHLLKEHFLVNNELDPGSRFLSTISNPLAQSCVSLTLGTVLSIVDSHFSMSRTTYSY